MQSHASSKYPLQYDKTNSHKNPLRRVSPRVKPAAHYSNVVANILCARGCDDPFPRERVYADVTGRRHFKNPLHGDKEIKAYINAKYGKYYKKKDLFPMVGNFKNDMKIGQRERDNRISAHRHGERDDFKNSQGSGQKDEYRREDNDDYGNGKRKDNTRDDHRRGENDDYRNDQRKENSRNDHRRRESDDYRNDQRKKNSSNEHRRGESDDFRNDQRKDNSRNDHRRRESDDYRNDQRKNNSRNDHRRGESDDHRSDQRKENSWNDHRRGENDDFRGDQRKDIHRNDPRIGVDSKSTHRRPENDKSDRGRSFPDRARSNHRGRSFPNRTKSDNRSRYLLEHSKSGHRPGQKDDYKNDKRTELRSDMKVGQRERDDARITEQILGERDDFRSFQRIGPKGEYRNDHRSGENIYRNDQRKDNSRVDQRVGAKNDPRSDSRTGFKSDHRGRSFPNHAKSDHRGQHFPEQTKSSHRAGQKDDYRNDRRAEQKQELRSDMKVGQRERDDVRTTEQMLGERDDFKSFQRIGAKGELKNDHRSGENVDYRTGLRKDNSRNDQRVGVKNDPRNDPRTGVDFKSDHRVRSFHDQSDHRSQYFSEHTKSDHKTGQKDDFKNEKRTDQRQELRSEHRFGPKSDFKTAQGVGQKHDYRNNPATSQKTGYKGNQRYGQKGEYWANPRSIIKNDRWETSRESARSRGEKQDLMDQGWGGEDYPSTWSAEGIAGSYYLDNNENKIELLSLNMCWEKASKLFKKPSKALVMPPAENLMVHLENKFSRYRWPRGPVIGTRNYPNGSAFVEQYANGGSKVYYPHGGLAVAISAASPVSSQILVIRDPSDHTFFFDNSLLAELNSSGKGVVYGDDGVVRAQYSAMGGFKFDGVEKGQRWDWNQGGQRFCLKLNRFMSVRLSDYDKVFLNYYGNTRGFLVNVATGHEITLMNPDRTRRNPVMNELRNLIRPRAIGDRFDYIRGKFDQKAAGLFDRKDAHVTSSQNIRDEVKMKEDGNLTCREAQDCSNNDCCNDYDFNNALALAIARHVILSPLD